MKFKKSLFILILAVFLISIAGVCASDVNDTQMASQENAAIESTDENLITVEDSEPAVSTAENEEIVSAGVDDEIVGAENDLDVLSADSAKYSDLANEVGSGGNIKLKHKYYTYDSGYIMITQSNSVIDGNGAIIDMTGTNIFAFYIDYRALGTTIKNLTIKNSGASEGSAVYAWSPCTIENCSFINNQAWDNGGAVFFRLSGKVINCYFESNRVTGSNGTAGAVYFGSSGEVINCSFNGNRADASGAVYIAGNGSVINSTFVNNSANKTGGAILFFAKGNAINCSFINNTANQFGGACFCYDFCDARNCTFVNNSGDYGGALHFVKGQVIDCNFTNNHAAGDGGAIYGSGESNVANCNFINNIASRDGGAIDIEANGNVRNCTFVKNTADRYAGALLIYDSNVTNCKFVNNTAATDGGALLIGEDGVITNGTFVNNSATNENGGAIIIYGNAIVTNCILTYNTAGNYGGALLIYDNATVTNCTFVNNSATNEGGGALYLQSRGIVENCNFTDNSAYFGAALALNNDAFTVKHCNFVNNFASLGGGAVIGSGDIINCNFVNNIASRDGGAINFDAKGNAINCSFTGNNALFGGAIFWRYTGNIEVAPANVISGCVFVNNSADNGIIYSNCTSGFNHAINNNIFLNNDGVAIYFVKSDSTSNVDYNWFGNNATNYDIEPITNNAEMSTWLFLNATANPDAIPIFDSSEIMFKLYAYAPSGVSEFDNSLLKAINLTLTPTNGNVNITEVGLDEPVRFNPEDYGICKLTAKIENVKYTTTLEISDGTSFFDLNFVINGNDNDTIILDRDYTYNSTFDYNLNEGIVINRPLTIVGNGHTLNATALARIFSIQANNVVIENITFVNGKTDRHGGAIFWSGNNANISDCIFVNNSADQQGAAINLDGDDSVVSNCIFVNNNAYSGGAVYWSGDNGNFSGCSFVNNSARLDGGALTFISYKGSVSGCSFVNNSASLDGGAIYLDESDEGIVSDCSFVNNYADRQGGAISWRYTKDGIVSGCSFVDNSASDGGAIYLENYDNGNVSGSIFVNNRANYGIVYFDNSLYGHLSVNDNIFLNNDGVAIYFVDSDSTSNVDYNWFGNNATNYNIAPTTQNVELGTWLFLNATAYPASISVSESSDILFKLYSYGASGVSDYDDSKLPVVNLTVTANNGEVDESIIALGDSVEFTPNGAGDASVTAAIENAEYTVVLDVAKADSILSADNLAMAYKDGSKWNVTLTDSNGNAISGRAVKIGIINKTYTFVTDENGVAGLAINLIAGTYAINATFEGDGDYGSSFVNATVTVTQAVATLSGVDLNMTYKDGSAWAVTLTNVDGDAIVGVKVAIGVAGKVYYIQTDDEGVAKLPINLPANTYTVNASFTNAQYEAELITATIVVNKVVPVLSAEDLVMNYKDGSAWNVTLTDADGNAMADTYVKLTVAGKTYNRKTNSEGVASLPINLGVGNHNITALFIGSANFGVVEINRTIVVNPPVYDLVANNINMTYQDGTNYTVQITDGEGSPVAQSGVVIKMTINGKSYDRKTNADGIASLPINLKAGTYEISAEYNGKVITNTIVVSKQ